MSEISRPASIRNLALMKRSSFICMMLAVATQFIVVPANATASVTIDESSDGITITANDATVESILSALHARFDVVYRGSVASDHPVSRIYKGTLPRVLSQILANYDFIATISGQHFEVTVIGLSNGDSRKGPEDTGSRSVSASIPAAEEHYSNKPHTPAASAASPNKPAAVGRGEVTSMLLTAAQTQLMGSAPLSSPSTDTTPSTPAPSDVVPLTQRSGAQLGALVDAMRRLTP